MLTGKVPFGGEGYGEIIVKHITMPPPSVRSVVPELPEFMDPIMYRVAGQGPRPALPDDGGVARGAARSRALRQLRARSSASRTILSGIARAAAPMARAELRARVAARARSATPARRPARRHAVRPGRADRELRQPDPRAERASRWSCCSGWYRRPSRWFVVFGAATTSSRPLPAAACALPRRRPCA